MSQNITSPTSSSSYSRFPKENNGNQKLNIVNVHNNTVLNSGNENPVRKRIKKWEQMSKSSESTRHVSPTKLKFPSGNVSVPLTNSSIHVAQASPLLSKAKVFQNTAPYSKSLFNLKRQYTLPSHCESVHSSDWLNKLNGLEEETLKNIMKNQFLLGEMIELNHDTVIFLDKNDNSRTVVFLRSDMPKEALKDFVFSVNERFGENSAQVFPGHNACYINRNIVNNKAWNVDDKEDAKKQARDSFEQNRVNVDDCNNGEHLTQFRLRTDCVSGEKTIRFALKEIKHDESIFHDEPSYLHHFAHKENVDLNYLISYDPEFDDDLFYFSDIINRFCGDGTAINVYHNVLLINKKQMTELPKERFEEMKLFLNNDL